MGLVTKIIQIHSDLLTKSQLISLKSPTASMAPRLVAHMNKCTCKCSFYKQQSESVTQRNPKAVDFSTKKKRDN